MFLQLKKKALEYNAIHFLKLVLNIASITIYLINNDKSYFKSDILANGLNKLD